MAQEVPSHHDLAMPILLFSVVENAQEPTKFTVAQVHDTKVIQRRLMRHSRSYFLFHAATKLALVDTETGTNFYIYSPFIMLMDRILN